MKLNRLLLCSVFALMGCNGNNNNSIKTYKELPEVKNDSITLDYCDEVSDAMGKNIYLSYHPHKINPVDEPLPAIKDNDYSQIYTNDYEGYIDSSSSIIETDIKSFAGAYASNILFLYANEGDDRKAFVEHQEKACEAYFRKVFCNASFSIDDKEAHIYVAQINKISFTSKRLRMSGNADFKQCYNSEFNNEYKNIVQSKQSESTINNFLSKYGVGLIEEAKYATYDIELKSYRVRYRDGQTFVNENLKIEDFTGATMDDYYHLTTFNEKTKKDEPRLFSYRIAPFCDSSVYPYDSWYSTDASEYFREVYKAYVARESEKVLKSEQNAQAKTPKMIKDFHYQLDNVTTEAKFSSSNPYAYEYSFNNSYKSYNLESLKQSGYKKMYIRPGTYIDQITNRTKVTFTVTISGQTITVFNNKQLIKTAGINEVNIPWYELDLDKVLEGDRKLSCEITPKGTKARIPLVQFEFAYTL